MLVYTPPRPPEGLAPVRVNLFSDTQTRPTRAMKEAMMAAEVGDEQMGLDPSVNALCDRMVALTGKKAAMFVPTGTMCNQIAMQVHCRPGDVIVAHKTSHILTSEGGGTSAQSGAQILGLDGEGGQFTAQALRDVLMPSSRYSPPQKLLSVEQTANLGGGTVWPLSTLNEVAAIAHAHGMATHMDGARLMNAVVQSGVPAAEMVATYDSLWLDFTKGLGAPLGAVLCGSAEFIDAAWRIKQRMGGAMRQGGVSAAGCLYALEHHVDRLAEDHANAAALARGLAQIEGLVVQQPQTNLVFCDTTASGRTGAEWATALRANGVMISVMGQYRIRACTHLDVDAAGIEETIAMFKKVAA